jgi:anti-sigma regulatory factor (Ser/Thr protein kinase)
MGADLVSPPVIAIPSQLNGQTLSILARKVLTEAKDGWPTELSFDFSQLGFIRPAGVVFLSNLLHWLQEKGTKSTLCNCDINKDADRFLDDSLFFEQHCGSKLSATSTPRSTTRPLQRIAHADSHAWLGTNLIPWLSARISITQASLYPIKACLSEIFNNIKDHTRYDIGSIFVQHFPQESRVIVAVSDFGLGIPDSVRTVVENVSDSDAILRAVQDGFTTRSTPGNKGIGLDYLLKTVVLHHGGKVTIYSSGAIVRFDRDENSIQSQVLPNVGFCPGTTIDIEFRTDNIEVLPEESEELQW